MIVMKPIFSFSRFSYSHGIGILDKQAEVCLRSAHFDLHLPFLMVFAPVNSGTSRGIISLPRPISMVRAIRRRIKVFPTIIVSNMIVVVDLICREFARHIEPHKAVGWVSPAIDLERDSANSNTIARGNPPGKQPSKRIVMECFFETILGYTLDSHVQTSYLNVIRGRSVDADRTQTVQNIQQKVNLMTAVDSCSMPGQIAI